MANKQKVGLTYFPFDVDLFNDIKVRKLIKYQSGKSVTVYTHLLCSIYKNGYFIKWDSELPFIISEDTGYEEGYINEVIKCCFQVGLLSEIMYQKNKILTSKGIQERYTLICKQLKRSAIVSENYMIVSEEIENPSEEIDINSGTIPQRKGKEKKSKLNKIKVKENIELTQIEIEKLKNDFGEEVFTELVEFLSNYKTEKNYKTKDDNLTIRRWVIDAVNEKRQKKINGKQTTTTNSKQASVRGMVELAHKILGANNSGDGQ